MTGDTLQTEFPFTLPNGFVGEDGTLHREGTMRLATAADEILPLKDPRVRSNEPYLTVILLSRVVTRLGSLPDVTPQTVENLFVADLAHLQDMYERVNERGRDAVDATCPDCGETFAVEVGGHTHDAVDGPAPPAADGGGDGSPGVGDADPRPSDDAQGSPPAGDADGGPGNGRSPTAGSRSGDAGDPEVADREPADRGSVDRGSADRNPAGRPAGDSRSSTSSMTTRADGAPTSDPAGREG